MNTPAFPSTNALATASGVMTHGHPGMTLRDYFAAAALQGGLSNNRPAADHEGWARWSYRVADAMLAAREGGAA
jgi:hypothetical protein